MAQMALNEKTIVRLFKRYGVDVGTTFYDPMDDERYFLVKGHKFVLPRYEAMTVADFEDKFVKACVEELAA